MYVASIYLLHFSHVIIKLWFLGSTNNRHITTWSWGWDRGIFCEFKVHPSLYVVIPVLYAIFYNVMTSKMNQMLFHWNHMKWINNFTKYPWFSWCSRFSKWYQLESISGCMIKHDLPTCHLIWMTQHTQIINEERGDNGHYCTKRYQVSINNISHMSFPAITSTLQPTSFSYEFAVTTYVIKLISNVPWYVIYSID